jgi:hypothetical protein
VRPVVRIHAGGFHLAAVPPPEHSHEAAGPAGHRDDAVSQSTILNLLRRERFPKRRHLQLHQPTIIRPQASGDDLLDARWTPIVEGRWPFQLTKSLLPTASLQSSAPTPRRRLRWTTCASAAARTPTPALAAVSRRVVRRYASCSRSSAAGGSSSTARRSSAGRTREQDLRAASDRARTTHPRPQQAPHTGRRRRPHPGESARARRRTGPRSRGRWLCRAGS